MATKPATTPPIWASNANWTTGLRAGSPTKVAPTVGEAQEGQVGESTFKAQWSNYLHNLATTWIATWLALGSSTGAADAHIVETDANGYTSVRRLDVLGGVTSTYGLQATGTTGAGPATGIRGTGVGAAPGVSGIGGNGNASGSGDAYTGGWGVRGISGSGTGAAGVVGIGLAGGDRLGVIGRGSGASAGVDGEGGATGAGVVGRGGSTGGVGVSGTGTGSSAGVSGTGGPTTGPGVLGTGGSTSAIGVDGRTAASATSSAVAVRGLAVGDGVGVSGQAQDGYGVIAVSDASSPTRSAFRISPQDADPTTAATGDMFVSDESIDGNDRDELRVYLRGAWRSVVTEDRGAVRAYGRNSSTVTATTSGVAITALTGVSLASPNEPRETGAVWLEVFGEVGRATGSGQNVIVRVIDETAGTTVSERTIELFEAAASWERHVSWLVPYTLPDVGARSFGIEIETTSTGDNVRIRDAGLHVRGVL